MALPTPKEGSHVSHATISQERIAGAEGDTAQRISTEAALAGALALLTEGREPGSLDVGGASVETRLAGAGLTSREIGLVTGQAPDVVDARLNAEGPALWRTIKRQRAAMAEPRAAR
jgi:hypothetical protein